MKKPKSPALLAIEADIRARLIAYMQTRRITNLELAHRLGDIDDGNLGRILKGDRGMSVEFLLSVMDLLRLPAEMLIDEPVRRLGPRRRDNSSQSELE